MFSTKLSGFFMGISTTGIPEIHFGLVHFTLGETFDEAS